MFLPNLSSFFECNADICVEEEITSLAELVHTRMFRSHYSIEIVFQSRTNTCTKIISVCTFSSASLDSNLYFNQPYAAFAMSDLEVVTSFFQPSTRAETEKFCSSRHNSFIRVPAVDLHPLKFSFLEKKFGPNCPLCRILVKGVIAHVPENHSKSVLISMGEKENKALDSPRILPSFSINLEEVRDGHKDIELFSTGKRL